MTKGLSPQEERFVQEFLVDRDAHQAALRTGVARINLKKTVQKWMSSPEILNAIKLATMNMKIEDMVSPQQVIAGFMDVAFDKNAPASARNSALKELASLKEMYKPEEQGRNVAGVMLIPAAPALTDWAAAALAQQQKLKDDVRH